MTEWLSSFIYRVNIGFWINTVLIIKEGVILVVGSCVRWWNVPNTLICFLFLSSKCLFFSIVVIYMWDMLVCNLCLFGSIKFIWHSMFDCCLLWYCIIFWVLSVNLLLLVELISRMHIINCLVLQIIEWACLVVVLLNRLNLFGACCHILLLVCLAIEDLVLGVSWEDW